MFVGIYFPLCHLLLNVDNIKKLKKCKTSLNWSRSFLFFFCCMEANENFFIKCKKNDQTERKYIFFDLFKKKLKNS